MTTTATELTMFESVSDSIARAVDKATPAQLSAPSPLRGVVRARRPQPHDRGR